MGLINEEKVIEKAIEYGKYMTNLRTRGQSTSICLSREDHQQEGFIEGVDFAETELKDMAIEFAEWIFQKYVKLNGTWCLRFENQTDKGNYYSSSELFAKFQEQINQKV